MKKALLVLAMVLLSTEAGACDWCLDTELQADKLGISKEEATKRLNESMWDRFKNLPLKGTIPDPTATNESSTVDCKFTDCTLSDK